jgi:hypothetical protein
VNVEIRQTRSIRDTTQNLSDLVSLEPHRHQVGQKGRIFGGRDHRPPSRSGWVTTCTEVKGHCPHHPVHGELSKVGVLLALGVDVLLPVEVDCGLGIGVWPCVWLGLSRIVRVRLGITIRVDVPVNLASDQGQYCELTPNRASLTMKLSPSR